MKTFRAMRDVVLASDPEMQNALDIAVKKSGLTYPELREQANSGRFESVRARLAWMTVSGVERELGTSER